MASWLRATPAEHMDRVVAQGDLRPMADNREAMADLQAILATRQAMYARADEVLDTSGRDVDTSAAELGRLVRHYMHNTASIEGENAV